MNQNFIAEYLPYIFLGIGLILIAVSVFYTSKNGELKTSGIHVEGIVFEQGYDTDSFFHTHDFETSNIKDKITVRFVTRNDEWITGAIKQDFVLFYNQYKDGQTVKVFYDEANPSNFFVDTAQSELIGRVLIAVVGLIFTIFGLFQIYTEIIN